MQVSGCLEILPLYECKVNIPLLFQSSRWYFTGSFLRFSNSNELSWIDKIGGINIAQPSLQKVF